MVVHGLDDYIAAKCTQCIKRVSLLPSDTHKTQETILYIVDGHSFLRYIIKKTSWIFGGQWKEINEEVIKFVNDITCQKKGAIKLLFVMPHTPDFCTPVDVQNVKSGLDFIASYSRPPSTDFYQTHRSAYYTITRTLELAGIEVLCSVSDYNVEVAMWAKVSSATGIISNNNEYCVMNTVPLYKLDSLDINDLTMEFIDRNVISRTLGLKVHNLPILSCILGNAIFEASQLQAFHKKLCSGLQTRKNYIPDIMPRLCMYVRPHHTPYAMLARTALQDVDKAAVLEDVVNRYNLSEDTSGWSPNHPIDSHLMIYDSQIHEAVAKKQIHSQCIPFIHDILTHHTYLHGLSVEHEPSLKTTTFGLYRPLRALCYGIILGGDVRVTEQICGIDTSQTVVIAEGVTVNDNVVRLDSLWNDVFREKFKWRVFVKCCKVTFNSTLARQLPEQYLGLVCVLNYWWHSTLINLSEWELNAFIAQAISQYSSDVASLQRVLVSFTSARAVSLANLFTCGIETLLKIASVVDLPLPLLLPYNYFDGKLFSYYYYLAGQGQEAEKLCDKLPDRLEMFTFLKMMVQSEGLSIQEDESDVEGLQDQDLQEQPRGVQSIVPAYEAISDDEPDVESEHYISEMSKQEGDHIVEEISSQESNTRLQHVQAPYTPQWNYDKENLRQFPVYSTFPTEFAMSLQASQIQHFTSDIHHSEHLNTTKRRKSEES